jgi:hypothetical protein
MQRLMRAVWVVWLTGCASATPAPAPTPVDPPPPELPPIRIVDAPPPTVAEPPAAPEPAASNPLLERLTADSTTLREDASEISKRQPAVVQAEAAARVLAIGKEINSKAWRDKARATIEQANTSAGRGATAEQLDAQVASFQDQRAVAAYDAMAELGGDDLADFLLGEAESATLGLERRRAAFVAAGSAVPGDASRASRRAGISAELVKLGAKEPRGSLDTQEAMVVTRRLAPGFRRCYKRAREIDPTLEVRFRLSLDVDARGAVKSSKAEATPAKDLAKCIEAVGRGALFSPPGGSGTVIDVPIAFTPNGVRTL